MSPVFSWVGISGTVSALLCIFVTIFLMIALNYRISFYFLFFFFLVFVFNSVNAIYWNDIRFLGASVFLLAAGFVVQFASLKTFDVFVDFATVLSIILLVGAVFGFFLALYGVSPLLDFPRPGNPSQKIYLFYTTLSNYYYQGVLRPSGIYDEPGAFSLYLCAVAAMRHLLNKNKKVTWGILFMGFVTLSLAHLIYVFFHALSERIRDILVGLVVVFFLSLVTYSIGVGEVFSERLFSRLVISDGGGVIEGDNRSYMMFNVVDVFRDNPRAIVFGADPSCTFDYLECKQNFAPAGANPLTPMFRSGLMTSWPYYMFLVISLFAPFLGRKYFVVFGFGLLFTQRPEMLLLSGATIGVSVFVLFFKTART